MSVEPRTLEDICHEKINEARARAESYQCLVDYWQKYLDRDEMGEIELKPRHNLEEYTEGYDSRRAVVLRDRYRGIVEESTVELLHWEAQLARLGNESVNFT